MASGKGMYKLSLVQNNSSMKQKYTVFIGKVKGLVFQGKVDGGDFCVAKHWRYILMWTLGVTVVFIGVGVYLHFSLDLLRQNMVTDENVAGLVVPDSESVKRMVTQYETKFETFNTILSTPPEAPDFGLRKVAVEEEVADEEETKEESDEVKKEDEEQ